MKPDRTEAALDLTKDTYLAYIDWGKSGFPTPVPAELASKLTSNSLELMVADARWYGESGLLLHGNVEILDLKVSEQKAESAVVHVVLDDSNLSFTVDGVPRKKLRNEVTTVDVSLIYDGSWKVDQIESLGNSQSSG